MTQEDVHRPLVLTLPIATSSQISSYQGEVGAIVYDSTLTKLRYCVATAASAGSWLTVGTTATS